MFNTALIGCGYWGSKLKRYIEENRNFKLQHICNSKSNLNEIWQDDNIDVVVVAVGNEQRYPIVRDALLYGKHVLCEKPLSLAISEAKNLKQLSLDYKLALVVDFTWTVSRGLKKARSLISEGAIGKLLGIEMSFKHLGRFQGGGVYWLLGSHGLSTLNMFVPLNSMKYERKDIVSHNGEIETGVISFTDGQISGQIFLSLNYPHKTTEVILYGSEGTIVYSPTSHHSLLLENYTRLKWVIDSKLPKKKTHYWSNEENNLHHVMSYFANVLKGKADTNIDSTVAITEILESLQR